MSSSLSRLFDKHSFLTTTTGGPGFTGDGSGRFMESSLVIRLMAAELDASTSSGVVEAPKVVEGASTQMDLFPAEAKPSETPSEIHTGGFNETTEDGAEATNSFRLNPDFFRVNLDFVLPPVDLGPQLDAAFKKLETFGWMQRLTKLEPNMTPLGGCYKSIPNHRLIGFVVELGGSRKATPSTGIYSDSISGNSHLHQCFGALVIGTNAPVESSLPQDSQGPLLQAQIDTLSDGTPVMLHIMYRVETVDAVRSTPQFKNYVVTETQKLKAKAAENKTNWEKENEDSAAEKVQGLLSDPALLQLLMEEIKKAAK